MEENHPDNIGASLFGGFIGSFLETINRAHEQPHALNGHAEIGITMSRYPSARARCFQYPWSPAIKIITIIPEYEVKTESARAVLPPQYKKDDVVFNLQRVAVLTHLLGQSAPDTAMIYEAMQDRMHQYQREKLVNGIDRLLQMTPECTPGGICLSGAGPSILALATNNFEEISQKIISTIQSSSSEPIRCDWQLLEPAKDGAMIAPRNPPSGFGSWVTGIADFVSRAIRTKA